MLNNTRETHFGGIGGLRLTEILAAADLFDVQDRKEFSHLVYILDREFLRLMAERTKKQQEAESKKGKKSDV